MSKSKSKFAIRYTLEEFAAEVARLYDDAVLWSTLPAEGRPLVAERYSPAAVRVRLRQALTELGVLEP